MHRMFGAEGGGAAGFRGSGGSGLFGDVCTVRIFAVEI